jgi:hypothetical protein
MKAGVKAMFIAKLKATVATLMVIASLGAVGIVYSGGGEAPTGSAKPPSEVDKLRKENELLRVNLRVTLEKIQALENELRAFKGPDKAAGVELRWSVLQPAQPSAYQPLLPLGNKLEQPRLEPSGDNSATPILPRHKSNTPKDLNKRQGGGSQIPPPSTSLPPTQAELPNPSSSRPPVADQEHIVGALPNTNKVIEDLSRALNTLADPKAGQRQESLRRAVQTLERLLNELRSLDGNRVE